MQISDPTQGTWGKERNPHFGILGLWSDDYSLSIFQGFFLHDKKKVYFIYSLFIYLYINMYLVTATIHLCPEDEALCEIWKRLCPYPVRTPIL